MITYAKNSDRTSDLFRLFTRKHGLVPFEHGASACWEYPWLYYHVKTLNDNNLLILKDERLHLIFQEEGKQSSFEKAQKNAHDIIVGTRLFADQTDEEINASLAHLYDILRPGGFLLFTHEYQYNIDIQPNINRAIFESSFIPYVLEDCTLIPNDHRVNDHWVAQVKDIFIYTHDHQTKSILGIILFKPYDKESLYNIRMSVNPLMKYKNDNEIGVYEYLAWHPDFDFVKMHEQNYRRIWLPLEMFTVESFSFKQLQAFFEIEDDDTILLIVNELICKNVLIVDEGR